MGQGGKKGLDRKRVLGVMSRAMQSQTAKTPTPMLPKSGPGLYCIEPLLEIMEACFFTSCIREENPVSIILVGPSGIAKSMMITHYNGEALRATDSITSQGLFDIANGDTKNLIKFLLIPDLNPTMSRKPTTVQSTVASLLSFTADGTVRVDDGRHNKECKHSPVGIVTSATDDIYNKHAKKWYALGLRRRIIPLFFKYTIETTRHLQKLVREGRIHSIPPPTVKLRLNQKAKPAISDNHLLTIESLSIRFSILLGKLKMDPRGESIPKWYVREVVPIAPQITLNTLAKAHALRDDRGTVTESDMDFIARFLDFCDPEHPREI